MIRIDEIYNNTFWPWIDRNLPGTRMFFCDPFGHTRPENLFNHGHDDIVETDYVFFHDQEPIQIEAHKDLFFKAWDDGRAAIFPEPQGRVVVSEKGSHVTQLCDIYGWKSSYYFFHGWACLDWYRGYDRTFLFPPPDQRDMPESTFMSPNRIVGGERDHRVIFIYLCIKHGLTHNHVSAPRICPVENVDIAAIGQRYSDRYPDIVETLTSAALPWLYHGEDTQQMTSCWLGNFPEAMSSMIYVPTETVFFGQRTHLTEKTFKAIALGMPFVLVAPAGSLAYLKEYGFRTFDSIWDESYDTEINDFRRLDKVAVLLKQIDAADKKTKAEIWQQTRDIVLHNWQHFYGHGFESILWRELTGMLDELRV